MGGRALLVVLGALVTISGTMFLNIQRLGGEIAHNADVSYNRLMAQNIAQSGANLALRQFANDTSWRTGFDFSSMMGGRLVVTCKDTVYLTRACLKITSTGTVGSNSRAEAKRTSIVYTPTPFVPNTVKAAITTNSPVTTLGTITIDGRDHNLGGGLIAGQGAFGIWTTKTLSQGGASTIGGTYAGLDYSPAQPASTDTYRTNQAYPGGYPTSPDSILGGPEGGFPEGTLKAIAQSGFGGSQYVTSGGSLTFPLKGVTYVELPPGGSWQSMDLNGSGILIVHNTARNALISNINTGTFTGLMIVDDISRVHSTIIGAIISLTPNPSAGNCIGNGTGTVLFSKRAILGATSFALSTRNGNGANVIAWYE